MAINFVGHTNTIYSVAWSPGDDKIASGAYDNTVKIWDPKTGNLLVDFINHTNGVRAVAWSPDGAKIASGGLDNVVNVWDVNSGVVTITFAAHTNTIFSIAWSPDGSKIISAGANNETIIWDPLTGNILLNPAIHTSIVLAAVWSPDGTQIASGGYDNAVKIWDATNGNILFVFTGHSYDVFDVKWSQVGNWIASISTNGWKVWDPISGNVSAEYVVSPTSYYRLDFSPDGSKLVVLRNSNKFIQIYETHTTTLLESIMLDENADALSWNHEGNMIVGTGASTMKLSEIILTETKYYDHHNALQQNVYSVKYSPDETKILSGADGGGCAIVDVETEEVLVEFTGMGSSTTLGVDWSPDGNKAVCAGTAPDHDIYIWDTSTGNILLILSGHTGNIQDVIWSSDGTKIISGSLDDTVKIWNSDDGSLIRSLEGHSVNVRSISMSPDGTKIASGGDDDTVNIWDVSTGNLLVDFTNHTHDVRAVAWSPDGTKIASGGLDYLIRIWDSLTGEELFTLDSGQSRYVYSLAWNPGGDKLAVGDSGGDIYFWDVYSKNIMYTRTGAYNTNSMEWNKNGTHLLFGYRYNVGTVKLINTNDKIYLKDSITGTTITPDPCWPLYLPVELKSVRHGQSSDVRALKFVNNSGGAVQNVLITVTKETQGVDLTLSKTEDPFEALQSLSFTGPYSQGDEDTFYIKLDSTNNAPLGPGILKLNITAENA